MLPDGYFLQFFLAGHGTNLSWVKHKLIEGYYLSFCFPSFVHCSRQIMKHGWRLGTNNAVHTVHTIIDARLINEALGFPNWLACYYCKVMHRTDNLITIHLVVTDMG